MKDNMSVDGSEGNALGEKWSPSKLFMHTYENAPEEVVRSLGQGDRFKAAEAVVGELGKGEGFFRDDSDDDLAAFDDWRKGVGIRFEGDPEPEPAPEPERTLTPFQEAMRPIGFWETSKQLGIVPALDYAAGAAMNVVTAGSYFTKLIASGLDEYAPSGTGVRDVYERLTYQAKEANQHLWDKLTKTPRISQQFSGDAPDEGSRQIVEELFPGLGGVAKESAVLLASLVTDPGFSVAAAGTAIKATGASARTLSGVNKSLWQDALDKSYVAVQTGQVNGAGLVENAFLRLFGLVGISPDTAAMYPAGGVRRLFAEGERPVGDIIQEGRTSREVTPVPNEGLTPDVTVSEIIEEGRRLRELAKKADLTGDENLVTEFYKGMDGLLVRVREGGTLLEASSEEAFENIAAIQRGHILGAGKEATYEGRAIAGTLNPEDIPLVLDPDPLLRETQMREFYQGLEENLRVAARLGQDSEDELTEMALRMESNWIAKTARASGTLEERGGLEGVWKRIIPRDEVPPILETPPILKKDGSTFTSEKMAEMSIKRRGLEGHTVEPAPGGGFQIRPPSFKEVQDAFMAIDPEDAPPVLFGPTGEGWSRRDAAVRALKKINPTAAQLFEPTKRANGRWLLTKRVRPGGEVSDKLKGIIEDAKGPEGASTVELKRLAALTEKSPAYAESVVGDSAEAASVLSDAITLVDEPSVAISRRVEKGVAPEAVIDDRPAEIVRLERDAFEQLGKVSDEEIYGVAKSLGIMTEDRLGNKIHPERIRSTVREQHPDDIIRSLPNRPKSSPPKEESLLEYMKRVSKEETGSTTLFSNPAFARLILPHVALTSTGFDLGDPDGIPVGPFKVGWSLEKYVNSGLRMSLGLAGAQAAYKAHGKWGDQAWAVVAEKVPRIFNVLRSFSPTERLSPDLLKQRKRLIQELPLTQRRLHEKVTLIMKDLTDDQKILVSDFVEKEGGWERADAAVRKAARESVLFHREMRAKLVAAGYSEEVLNTMGDQYMQRIYADRAKGLVGRKFKKFMEVSGSYMARRGTRLMDPPEGYKEAFKDLKGRPLQSGDVIQEYIVAGEKVYVDPSDTRRIALLEAEDATQSHVWKVSMQKGKPKISRDYTRLERQAMGEDRNAQHRMHHFVTEVSRDVLKAEIFQDISRNRQWALPPGTPNVPDDWILLSKGTNKFGVKKFGMLGGYKVHPEVAYALNGFDNLSFQDDWANSLWNANKKSMQVWKMANTAGSPITHGVNFMSNFSMSFLRGDNPIKVSRQGAASILNRDKYFQEAVDVGLLDGTMLRTEAGLKEWVERSGRFQEEPFMKRWGRGMQEFLDIARKDPLEATKRAAASPITGALRLYNFEDEMFRMGTFRALRDAGVDATEALRHVNEVFFDYRDVPRGIGFLRDSGLSPFITWSYKMTMAMPGVVARRPGRALSVILGWQLYNDVNYALQFEEASVEMERRERQALPEYLSGPEARMFLVGPYRAARKYSANPEAIEFHDWGRFVFPLSDLGQSRFGDYTMAHPALNILSVGMTGRSLTNNEFQVLPHQGREELLTDSQKAENIMAFVDFTKNMLLPNNPLVPGSFSQKDVVRTLVSQEVITPEFGEKWFGVKGPDNQGLPTSWSKGMGDLIGAKTRQFQLTNLEDAQVGMLYKAVGDAEKRIIGLMYKEVQKGTVTNKDIERAERQYDEAVGKLFNRLDEMRASGEISLKGPDPVEEKPAVRKNPFPNTPALVR